MIEKIAFFQLLFSEKLAEDPQDGTPFDIEVLDALDALRAKYRKK